MKHISNQLKNVPSLSIEEEAKKYRKEKEKNNIINVGDEVNFIPDITRLRIIGKVIEEIEEKEIRWYIIETLWAVKGINLFKVPIEQVKRNES